MNEVLEAVLGTKSFHETVQPYLPDSCRQHACEIKLRNTQTISPGDGVIVLSYFQHRNTETGVITLYPLYASDIRDMMVDVWGDLKPRIAALHLTHQEENARA